MSAFFKLIAAGAASRAGLAATEEASAASMIWSWLVQMGPGRGGAYTYDWIENLFGLKMHSADQILPQERAERLAAAAGKLDATRGQD